MPFITQDKTNWKLLLTVVILSAVVSGGILLYSNSELSETKLIEMVIEDKTVDWKNYRSEKHGLEFKYPSIWFVEENGDLINIFSHDPSSYEDFLPITIERSKIQIQFHSKPETQPHIVYMEELVGQFEELFGDFDKEIFRLNLGGKLFLHTLAANGIYSHELYPGKIVNSIIFTHPDNDIAKGIAFEILSNFDTLTREESIEKTILDREESIFKISLDHSFPIISTGTLVKAEFIPPCDESEWLSYCNVDVYVYETKINFDEINRWLLGEVKKLGWNCFSNVESIEDIMISGFQTECSNEETIYGLKAKRINDIMQFSLFIPRRPALY